MNKDYSTIRQLISGASLGVIRSVNHIGGGFASLAYKVKGSEGEFIVLTQKSDSIGAVHYDYNFAILKGLEEIQYRFSPRAVYVNPQHTAIVLTFVPGEPITWINTASDVSEEQEKRVVGDLVSALIDQRELSFLRCAELYKAISGKGLKATTIQKNVEKYLSSWFALAQTGRPDPEITKWIAPKVTNCEHFVRDLKPSTTKIFGHSDTSEPNILLTRDFKLNLIDWDGSGFNQFPDGWDDYGIGYLFNHVPLFQKYRSLVTSLVTERCRISLAELESALLRQQELITLGDIMWAYMMNARVAAGEIKGDPTEFLATAQERIAGYKKQFAQNSFLLR